jgi:predicted Rossmann fold flavoprotein
MSAQESTQHYDVIVLGAGAAGMMCALMAGQRGKRVLLVEHNDLPGKKIRISGGGRCNFTNVQAEPARYISNNPRFCYSALSRYTPKDFIALVERHGIAYHEKKLGQLFCDDSAQQIIDALLDECAQARVVLKTNCRVQEVTRNETYEVQTSQGTFAAPALVIATGGLSIPKLGATDLGYRIARQFGVPVLPCVPALVPITLPERDLRGLADLSGISFEAAVSVGKTTFEENVLITHRGLSGPAILQISSYWEPGKELLVDLFPGQQLGVRLEEMKKKAPRTLPLKVVSGQVSNRFAQRLCEHHHWERPLGEMSGADLRAMAEALQQWRIPANGTEGYAKAEVTRGGVDTRALNPKSMEAREVPGLYFIGEVMDVTGWLGGYNFQWAWASAVAAGSAV